ncbi:MAG: sensor histidine kinase [Nitriliruptoraceae bacterium]
MRDALVAELRLGFGSLVEVLATDQPRDVLADLDTATTVGLILVLDDERSSDDRIAELAQDPRGRGACTLLITDRGELDDVGAAIDGDRIAAVIPVPWPAGRVAEHARAQLARRLRSRNPADPRLAHLDRGGRPLELPTSSLLRDLEADEQALTDRLVAAFDRALGRRPRLRLPAGTRLTHQGVGVDGVVVVLAGSVALDRASEVGELRLHHASTGPVVGLLSLTQQRQAFFTARATTDVLVVHISLEQLDHALDVEPDVGAAMAAATARALARRLRRAEQLQVEKIQLNRELDRERASLATALHELEDARLELVESARMATLGELSAGIAHELNNPASAVRRAATFIAEDLRALLADHPDGTARTTAFQAGLDSTPLPTARQRALRAAMTEVVADRAMAHRLVDAGLTDPDVVQELTRGRSTAGRELLATAAELGAAVRNLERGTTRIGDLVRSLRSYARPTDAAVEVDVRTTLDDALQLVSHRLDGLEVVRDDDPELPTIAGHPGPLGQVWTNLVLNAVDALDGSGRLTIRSSTDGGAVLVSIADDGPGIPPELLDKLFEPRFTTKQGRVRYGLGLGLAISERIVHEHGGTIKVTSEPGDTVVTVRLPVA